MKYFVFSDCYGFFSILQKELIKLGFDESNPEHMLISLGDNFDRGNENYQMFMFLKDMKEKNKIILIKGNHEDLLLDMFIRESITNEDYSNGTYDTVKEFAIHYFGIPSKNIFFTSFANLYYRLKEDNFFDLLYDMVDYYETEDFIFTHGFIPILETEEYQYNPLWRNSSRLAFRQARWLNGMEMSIYHHIKEDNKKIVVGHWHSSYGNVRKKYGIDKDINYHEMEFKDLDLFTPYIDENIIAIDACTVYTKKINVIIIDN